MLNAQYLRVSWARGRTPGLPASNGDRLGSQWHGCHVGDHNLPTLTAFLAAREPFEFESNHCDCQVCGRPPAGPGSSKLQHVQVTRNEKPWHPTELAAAAPRRFLHSP